MTSGTRVSHQICTLEGLSQQQIQVRFRWGQAGDGNIGSEAVALIQKTVKKAKNQRRGMEGRGEARLERGGGRQNQQVWVVDPGR